MVSNTVKVIKSYLTVFQEISRKQNGKSLGFSETQYIYIKKNIEKHL